MSATHKLISQLLVSALGTKKQLSIIDFGCGAGDLLTYLDGTVHIKKYHGYDISPKAIAAAKRLFSAKELRFTLNKKNQKTSFGKSNSQDAVVLVGVLQYLSDSEIESLFTEAKRVLKQDGYLVLSTTTDFWFYQLINIYQFVISHRYFKPQYIVRLLGKYGFITTYLQKGLIIAPLFSSVFSLFFDTLDKLLFKTTGELGIIGKTARKCIAPLIGLEFAIPLSAGYTTFIIAKKHTK